MRTFFLAFAVAVLAIVVKPAFADDECATPEDIMADVQEHADTNKYRVLFKEVVEDGAKYLVAISKDRAGIWFFNEDGCAYFFRHLDPERVAQHLFKVPLNELFAVGQNT